MAVCVCVCVFEYVSDVVRYAADGMSWVNSVLLLVFATVSDQ